MLSRRIAHDDEQLSVSPVALLQILANYNKVAADGHIFSRSLPISSSSSGLFFFWQTVHAYVANDYRYMYGQGHVTLRSFLVC